MTYTIIPSTAHVTRETQEIWSPRSLLKPAWGGPRRGAGRAVCAQPPGPAPHPAAHRESPRAPCGNAITARMPPLSLKLPPGGKATSVWLVREINEITSSLRVTARLRRQPLGTTGRLGTHPHESFAHLSNTTFLSWPYDFPDSAFLRRSHFALLLSGKFEGGTITLRPSTHPAAPGAFLPLPAGSPPGSPRLLQPRRRQEPGCFVLSPAKARAECGEAVEDVGAALTPRGFIQPRRNPLSYLGRETSQLLVLLGGKVGWENKTSRWGKKKNQVLRQSLL